MNQILWICSDEIGQTGKQVRTADDVVQVDGGSKGGWFSHCWYKKEVLGNSRVDLNAV